MRPPQAPQGLPPGGNVNPSPETMALANQVYQLQQMYLESQKRLDALANKLLQMQVTVHRDNDGKIAGMTLTEGVRSDG
jgi:hypothetical protein